MAVLPPKLKVAERDRLMAVYSNFRSFVRLLKVWDKHSRSWIPFVLNAEQERLLDIIEANPRVIVLKSRQIGVSTLIRAYAFWKTFTSAKPVRWGTLSFSKDSAQNLQAMDRGFLTRLPEALTKHRTLDTDTASRIAFGDTGASTAVFTAASRYGTRSYALSDAHISEFAYYERPEDLLATVMATVEQGSVIIESTPARRGDAYHRLVQGAQDGSNGWTLAAFWWWEHQSYRTPVDEAFVPTSEEEAEAQRYGLDVEQLAWRRQMVSTIGISKFKREYPACMADAFAALDGSFLTEADTVAIKELRFATPSCEVLAPQQGEVYVLGADVSGGVGGDYSTIVVVCASTRQVVYAWRSNTISPSAFASEVLRHAQRYNTARVLVESNNHGHVTLLRLGDYGYTNLWVDSKGKQWVTTAGSKAMAYEYLREYISEGCILFLPDVILEELRSLHSDGLAPSAPVGMHDDYAVALALAYTALRGVTSSAISSAKTSRLDAFMEQRAANHLMKRNLPWRQAT